MLQKLFLLAAFFLVSACGGGQKGSKDVLIVAQSAEAVSLDPYKSNDAFSTQVRANIFDRLIERNAQGELVPSLATEWKYINPTTLELKLREGVKFHNGEPFGAKDVKFSIERMLVSTDIKNIVDVMKGADVVSDYVVRINLKKPFAPFLAHLAHPVVSIMNEKAVTEAGDMVVQQPVGTGPFKLKEWNRGQNYILERNDEYWGGAPKLARIDMRIVPEASARTIALETGDVDVAYLIDVVDRERVQKNAKLVLAEDQAPRMEYISFNIGKGKNPIWKDARVREAVALALDIPGIITSVMFNAATPAGSLLQDSVFGAVKLPAVERNVERAKQLLAEAKVPAGTKVTLWTPQGYRQKIMEVIQNNLKEIGLDASIEVLEWGRYLGDTANGLHDIYILGWTAITLDADYGIYNLMHSSAQGPSGNRSFYANPQVDRLLDAGRSELNAEKRKGYYQTVQEIVRNDYGMIPLYYPYETVGLQKSVKGFGFERTASHRFKDTYKE